jgi:nucleoside-diphosphate-sugar epimerase
MAISYRQALITGGAGFIGSHIAEALVKQGCDVIIFDNLASGHIGNIAHLKNSVSFVQGDIQDDGALMKACKGCDIIFHHAAVVSVTQTVAEPITSAIVNDLGTLKVLELARQNGVKRVILASSSAVYGDDPQLPKSESMPARPQSPYAVQKWTNEQYAKLYYSLYGMETVCLRYFNVYGPRQDPSSPYSGVISIFMTKASQNIAPNIYGDGRQTRDFVFVKDVVQANLLAAENASAPGEVFNVGTGDSIEINTLWNKVAGIAHCELKPHHGSARTGDIIHSLANIQKASRCLGFKPSISFDEGLTQTFVWYQENIH